MKRKHIVEVLDYTWLLLKTYAASQNLSINQALEKILNDELAWLKEVLDRGQN